jgi:hypothetical protein
MSAGIAIPRVTALRVAESLRATLYGACDRVEIAGSIRREKPQVHDIEIVVVPRIVERASGDIWGDFFRAIGQPWIEPWERHVSRVAIRREIAAAVPS